jgi:hypothetical protein
MHGQNEKCIQNFGSTNPQGKRSAARPASKIEVNIEIELQEINVTIQNGFSHLRTGSNGGGLLKTQCSTFGFHKLK